MGVNVSLIDFAPSIAVVGLILFVFVYRQWSAKGVCRAVAGFAAAATALFARKKDK